MKSTLFVALSFASLAVAAQPVQNSVAVVLGPKAYREGDVIEITDVMATSRYLEKGDSVTVRGRVRLASRQSANLCLYLTQTNGNGVEETDSAQTTAVTKGRSDFELKTTIKHEGFLHVTFYDSSSGKPFGGTYFGTADQMKQIAEWNVQYYLSD
jgi:hypothetical protein